MYTGRAGKLNKFRLKYLQVDFFYSKRHPDAIEFCKKFSNKKIKDELLKKVYQLFNETVFDGKVNSV